MSEMELLLRLTAALAIGVLIGLERGWKTRRAEDQKRAAGFRTFALSGLLGGISAALAEVLGGLFIGFAFFGFSLAFVSFHWLQARDEGHFSVTTVVAGLVTFVLGALAVAGDQRIAAASAVAAALLLALREPLHRWIARLTWEEVRAVLILVAMTFLLLPFLPNRTVDPWDAINPYQIWLLAILIAAISFGGYVAMKVFGSRLGLMMTATAGGLASSTATTVTFARMARERPGTWRLLSAGILVSSIVMTARVGVFAAALNAALLPLILPALLVSGGALTLGAALLASGRSAPAGAELAIANPLDIGTTLRLAAILAVIMLSVGIVLQEFGDEGVIAIAAISGLADVDAVTISMVQMSKSTLADVTAVQAVLVSVAVNTVSKAAIAAFLGGRRVGLAVGLASLVALIGIAVAAAAIGLL
ncbi:MgtC/SapB family protein [Afifella pfennigii]|uniref:MgtC/SapB family protein n=1 Tax=Afifella pfennigii TaxID=209897 RepID=UPI00047E1852|nr:MgtC/SapB family protein [Afifella pfennigii]